ncbi:ABC transporter permease [Deinococcus metallilatus]|uniref:ABC transporter permease n=2 Tax=Deinococcus TaxID=1298 RepID=A0AAJ5F1W8_9DEIO|nr:ABC transporter permease [Deinococcus metallilatus]MBB5296992.1 ABC-type transport system involved in multi-copper enzyme maturation permease subunit [Deinococcus metallilatus]QBY07871.1 ABC transporter permease [Deinococcus metallilatus]RXJ13220.1 ABC transporter permease [Deinococcus metallilatus]TLK23007.1 ABC transporter permease [Deinococcus metallilatus]GMA15958.1 ABC transporter permease [Deinococcus metallilatus]
MRNALLIAELSLREAVRKRLVVVLLLLTAAFLGFYLYGVLRLEQTLDQRALDAGLDGRSVTGAANLPVMYAAMFGMYLVFFLGSLMAVLSTVGAVSGDVESGVMQSVIARPISRAQLVLGRWLGFTVVNVLYVALVSAALLGGIFLITGFLPPAPVPAAALILLAITLITALTVLGSTLFTTLANGIGVFVLYGAGFAGGILATIGTFADSPTLTTLGRVANTLMPTNALWLGASYHLQPDVLRQLGEMTRGANPFFASTPVAPGLVVWAAVYALVAVLVAMWQFSRRDL